MKPWKDVVPLVMAWLLVALLLAAPSLAQANQAKLVTYQITGTSVVDPGKTTTLPNGEMISGLTIQGQAATDDDFFPSSAIIKLTFNCFLPSKPMPGQSPGTWYWRASWLIADADSVAKSQNTRHQGGGLRGTFKAQAPTKPFEQADDIQAVLKINPTRTTDAFIRGKGVYKGNGNLEGQFKLNLVIQDIKNQQ